MKIFNHVTQEKCQEKLALDVAWKMSFKTTRKHINCFTSRSWTNSLEEQHGFTQTLLLHFLWKLMIYFWFIDEIRWNISFCDHKFNYFLRLIPSSPHSTIIRLNWFLAVIHYTIRFRKTCTTFEEFLLDSPLFYFYWLITWWEIS